MIPIIAGMSLPTIGDHVLHLDTLTTSRVRALLPRGAHRGADGQPVDEEVVELLDGNRFLAREGAFVVLTPGEATLLDQAQEELTTLLAGASFVLRRADIPVERAVLLLRSLLAMQLRSLSGSPPPAVG